MKMNTDNDESVICLDECPVPLPKVAPQQLCCTCQRKKRGFQIKQKVRNMVPVDVIDLSDSISDDFDGKRNPIPGECSVCLQLLCVVDQLATLRCGHVFCKTCITRAVFETKKCPKCRYVVPDQNHIITLYP